MPSIAYSELGKDEEKELSLEIQVILRQLHYIICSDNMMYRKVIDDITKDGLTKNELWSIIHIPKDESVREIIDNFSHAESFECLKDKIELFNKYVVNPNYIYDEFGHNSDIAKCKSRYNEVTNRLILSVYPMIYWCIDRQFKQSPGSDDPYRINRADIIADVASNAVITIIKKIYKFDHTRGKFTNFVYHVVTNVLFSWFNKQKKYRDVNFTNLTKTVVHTNHVSCKSVESINVEDFCQYLVDNGVKERDMEAFKTLIGLSEFKNMSRFAEAHSISKERASQLKDKVLTVAIKKYDEYCRQNEQVSLSYSIGNRSNYVGNDRNDFMSLNTGFS